MFAYFTKATAAAAILLLLKRCTYFSSLIRKNKK